MVHVRVAWCACMTRDARTVLLYAWTTRAARAVCLVCLYNTWFTCGSPVVLVGHVAHVESQGALVTADIKHRARVRQKRNNRHADSQLASNTRITSNRRNASNRRITSNRRFPSNRRNTSNRRIPCMKSGALTGLLFAWRTSGARGGRLV